MDGSLQKLIRAARGPILLMTLGVLLAVHQFTKIGFDQTFPVLIIVFGLMWMLERMAPRAASTTVQMSASSVSLPPMDHDPLLYDPLREVHRNVYGAEPRMTPMPVPVEQKDIPTAEIPIRPVKPPQ